VPSVLLILMESIPAAVIFICASLAKLLQPT
jgi:hypothetical protein